MLGKRQFVALDDTSAAIVRDVIAEWTAMGRIVGD
jgi:hypothetical protein